jgi:hypothetical protein
MESVARHDARSAEPPRARTRRQLPGLRPVLAGVIAAIALLALYLGLITLAQGWSHATQQLSLDRWYVGAIMLGFGTQVGLFTWLRTLHATAMAAGGMAASTGTSTAAMLACCAHHVADVLPVLGLSGAAIFLNDYKFELLWLGITMNAIGVGYLLVQVRKVRKQHAQLCHVTA